MSETIAVAFRQSRRLTAFLLLTAASTPVIAKDPPRPSPAPIIKASPPADQTATTETNDGQAYQSSVVTERQNPVGLPIVARDNSTTIIGGILMMALFLSLISYSIKKERLTPQTANQQGE